jgi:hypothetical protein
MAIWIALMPAKARALKYSNPEGDTWLSMKRAPDGHWDLEWVGYDAQSKPFRITQRVDALQGAELSGGIGAFVKLTPLPPGKRVAKKERPAEKGDLMLEMRSYDALQLFDDD